MDYDSRCFALLLGITEFSASRFAKVPLAQAANDANDLKNELVGALRWNPDNIIVLTGAVTIGDVKHGFARAADALKSRNDSLFLLYVSTHGGLVIDGRGDAEPMLLCANTTLENYYDAMDSGMPRAFISTRLRGIPARQTVLISDACHALGPTNPSDFRPDKFYRSFDVHVIGASVSEALIKEGDHNSLFTGCLLEAIRACGGTLDTSALFSNVVNLLHDREPSAPEPFNNAVGGLIILGRAPARATTEAVLANCLQQFSIKSQDRYAAARYVSRTSTAAAFDAFLNSNERCYTVVGKAGAGKTTLCLHLAGTALERGYPVVWVDGKGLSADAPAIEILKAESGRVGLKSPEELSRLFPHKPLLLFLDAINESTGTSDQVRGLCGELLNRTGEWPLRIIASCRETVWPTLAEPFVHQVFRARQESKLPAVSIPLTGFDDREMQKARDIYIVPESLARDPLAREPLFLKMLAELANAGAPAGEVSLGMVFEDYVAYKLARIAERLGRPVEEIDSAVSRLIAEMEGESLAAARLDSLVPAPVAYALLDEGLFRQAGELISVEAELIHEYLLSRTLPDDWMETAGEVYGYFRLWWGAAGFRLLRVDDPQSVLAFLRSIQDPNQMLAILPKLAWHPHYAAIRDEFLDSILRRIRDWFLEINYYDWEPKRWRDLDYETFRRRLKNELMITEAAPPKLLGYLFDQEPAFTFRKLLREWLGDQKALTGGPQSTIADVATIFLSLFATQNPRMCLEAVEDWFSDSPDTGRVQRADLQKVLLSAAGQSPVDASVYAPRWLERGWVPIAIPLIQELTEEQEPMVLPAIRRVLADPGPRFRRADGELLKAAGLMGTPDVLRLAESYLEDPTIGGDAVLAMVAVAGHRPAEADAAITAFVERGRAKDPAVFQSLVNYGRARISAEPKVALRLFARVLEASPYALNSQIASACLSVQQPGPEIAQFAEDRLGLETDANAIEYYGRLVARYRKIGSGDLSWLRRWTDLHPGHVWGLLGLLAESGIPLADQITIYATLDGKGADFIGGSVSSYGMDADGGRGRLRPYATAVAAHPDFARLSETTRDWFTSVANGADPNDASGRRWSKKREEE